MAGGERQRKRTGWRLRQWRDVMNRQLTITVTYAQEVVGLYLI